LSRPSGQECPSYEVESKERPGADREVRGVSAGAWDLEEIRHRADIVEIVSPHVHLRKAGRRLVGLCPFHQERTPSFTLDPESGLWHCFGCKAGGDLFRFVEMIEKVSFAEAVELLARRLGVPPRRPADAVRQRQRGRLLALHEEACKFFQAQLRAKPGERARAYLRRRAIAAETIEEFQLGYAPESWDALLEAMAKRGFKGEELARAGLAAPREGAQGFYDRFRDRVIFPIRDPGGRVIAFGGRALSEEQEPKYLNSPETALFQKGQTLWAFDRARRAMSEAGRAIVVEGYLDAIACHEAGLRETVATMGTALTSAHVDLLRRRVERLVLAFDSDSAGLAAALRGWELFLLARLKVSVASLPDGADPDAVVRKQGPEAFQELVAGAVDIVQWQLTQILARAAGKGEREQADAIQEAVAMLARVPPGADRTFYLEWVRDTVLPWLVDRSGVEADARRKAIQLELQQALVREEKRIAAHARRISPQAPGEGLASQQGLERPAAGRLQARLLAAFLQYRELAPRYAPTLEVEDFPTQEERGIFQAIRGLVDRKQPVTPQAVLEALDPEAREVLAKLVLEQMPPERIEESVSGAVRRVLENRLRQQESALRHRLDQASSEPERQALLRELTETRRQRSELAGQRLVGDH